jgi:hypothetical protein
MLKHNKKRNTGILYQLLVNLIAEGIVESDDSKIKVSKGLILKHFSPGTCLLTELKCFNSLTDRKTYQFNTVQEAKLLVDKIKHTASTINQEKLDLEKTALIHEINKTVGPELFSKELSQYKILATVQTVFNVSRNKTLLEQSFDKVFDLEQQIYGFLVEKSQPENNSSDLVPLEEIMNSDIQSITVKIFENKIEEKFSKNYSPAQKSILRLYLNDQTPELLSELNSIKQRILTKTLTKELASSVTKEDKVLYDKIQTIRDVLKEQELTTSKQHVGLILNVLSLEEEFLLEEQGQVAP